MVSNLDDERVWAEALPIGSLLTPAKQSERLKRGSPGGGTIGETDGWWGHSGEGFGFTAAVFHNDRTGATVVVFMNDG